MEKDVHIVTYYIIGFYIQGRRFIMSVNGINSTTPGASTYSTASTTKKASSQAAESKSNPAAVYEPSKQDTKKAKKYTQDTETVNRLLKETEQRKQQLKDLVQRTLTKQGETYNASMNIFDAIKSGNLRFSAEDIAQAKEDISEDGYWGVKQTSERIYSFAYALTGGDPSKADDMLKAVEKGFKQATGAWGSELPDITKQTMEAVREKFDAWKNGDVEG